MILNRSFSRATQKVIQIFVSMKWHFFLARQKSLFGHQFPVGKTFRGEYPCKDVTLSGAPFLNDKKDVSIKSPLHGTLSRVD